MQDDLKRLETMHRPRLLMQAARIAAADYHRDSALPRLFGAGTLPRPDEALTRLIEIEGWHDACRRENDAAYSVMRHIEAMAALLGEARLVQDRSGETPAAAASPLAAPQMKASGISALRRATKAASASAMAGSSSGRW